MNITKNKSGKNSWGIFAQKTIEYAIVEKFDMFDDKVDNSFLSHDERETRRRLVIIDKNVYRIYGSKIRSYFKNHNFLIHYFVTNVSEEVKNTKTLFKVLNKITNFNPLRRSEPIIGIGGGVLLDIVGLASNLYRRGTPYIRVPTTLMGLIDAGIGVKTGVNFINHKNRLGTYYPPLKVYIDPFFLNSLDQRHISNGLGEILKIAIIKDSSLFKLLETHGNKILKEKFQNSAVADEVIRKAISGMLEELEPNLWEINLQRLVDFGHTFSGKIEMEALPELLHGEAVTVDVIISCILSVQRGLLTQPELNRIIEVTKSLGLPIDHAVCNQELLADALKDSTFHRDGLQRLPIPNGIGDAIFINDITSKELASACRKLKII